MWGEPRQPPRWPRLLWVRRQARRQLRRTTLAESLRPCASSRDTYATAILSPELERVIVSAGPGAQERSGA